MKKAIRVILLICAIFCITLFVAACISYPFLISHMGGEFIAFASPLVVTFPGLAVTCFMFAFKKSFLKHISIPAGTYTVLAIYFTMWVLSQNEDLIIKYELLDNFAEVNYSLIHIYSFCICFFFPVLIMYLAWIITKGKFHIGKCAILTFTSFVIMIHFYLFFYLGMPGSILALAFICAMTFLALERRELKLKHKMLYSACVGIGGVAGMLLIMICLTGAHLLVKYNVLNGDSFIVLLTLRAMHADFLFMPIEIAAFLFGNAVCISILYLAHVIKEKKRSRQEATLPSASQEV